MAEKEQEQAEEPQSTEVTELSEENLEDVAGGVAPLDDVNNSSCNGNCGC